ncbi:MAG: type II toxin-antitoxin system RelE/ParE family toxin [Firmicutes bacterium]|nr:type II toxin-antitoxin system RelE/ParE family toxin [Bacillota bacterium]
MKDISKIFDYIAADNLEKAKEFTSELKNRVLGLSSFPLLGVRLKAGEPYKRKLIFGNYIVMYKIDEVKKVVSVMRIRHGSRKPLNS